MKINSEVMEQLFDASIRIEHVFHMQLVTACDSLPNAFWEEFDDNHTEILEALGFGSKESVGNYLLKSKGNLLDFLHDHKKHGVLIQFSTPIRDRFRFNDQGEFLSCSCSWSAYMSHFSYGQTLDEALRKAIAYQEEHFEQCITEAKQG
ncbi:hypothetical protein VSVS12_03241 [Vibrio scophthalmi]|uniref:hypothetical protein n=1 Tax=Vibrio scophthalmi TaxID=45658 RepID=UPI0008094973|nr:hypothetical protein [Vibrio scophthalmi]ANS86950.1 hypothetical protein VSVS12_03241 [Vibrio scophthalmi]